MKRFLIQRSELSSTSSSSSCSEVEETCTSTSSKRSKIGTSDSSKHLVGYNSQWEKEYHWLLPVRREAGAVTGMLCQICRFHKMKNKYNKSSVWSEVPCVCIRKDSVRRHSESLQHKEAISKEMDRERSSVDGGIQQAFQEQVSMNRAALKTAMQCLYWLVQNEIPHTMNYASLLEPVKFMECTDLKHLHCGENAKYTSRRITQEFIQVMGTTIEKSQLNDLLSAPFCSLLIDETTDIAVLKEMVIYARFISSDCQVQTVFLKIVELSNGTADIIEEALLAYLTNSMIPLSRLVGLATDGASVMIGRHSGVATRLKAVQPVITSIHCVAHRLALAAGQAGDKVKFIADTFKPTLKQLFYFYENSSVRLSALKSIQELLETPELKLKKPLDTRWLSHDAACQTLMKIFPSVIMSLECEAVEHGEALAVGLSKVVKRYNFIAMLYMMCDVLPKVSRLSRVFQLSAIDVSELNSQVKTTTESLEKLIDHPGEIFTKLDADLLSSLANYNIKYSPEAKAAFLRDIHTQFVKALLQNIKDPLSNTELSRTLEYLILVYSQLLLK